MIHFTMQAAGCIAAVSALFESTRDYCKGWLCGGEPDFAVAISPEDIAFEREKSLQEDRLEGIPPRTFTDAYLEITAVQRKITEHLFEHDTLLFHGSVVAVDGAAYLFTAKSGTGKSTHTRLWREVFGERAVMINDDKPFLQIGEQGVTVHGSPWMGKHRLGCNAAVPLYAICILTRGQANRIEPLPAREAVPMLLQQTNRPLNRGMLPRYMHLLDELSKRVEFYHLACNMEPEAAIVAYQAMSASKKG